MVLVGLIIPILLKNKRNSYTRLNQQDDTQDIHMVKAAVNFYFSGTKKK